MASGIFNITIAVPTKTEHSITAKLTFTGGVPFRAEVQWYRKRSTATGWTKVGAKAISKSSSTTSVSLPYTGLLANREYNLKAVVVFADSEASRVTKTTSAKTNAAAGTLACTVGSSYVKATVSGLTKNTDIDRYIQWYIKPFNNSSDGWAPKVDLSLFDSLVVGKIGDIMESPEWQLRGETKLKQTTTSASFTMKGLTKDRQYHVKAVLMSGTATLKTMTKDIRTNLVADDVPLADIDSVEQIMGTKRARVYWGSPEHIPGTTYAIKMKHGTGTYATLATVTEPPAEGGYTEVDTSIVNNATYTFIVESTHSRAPGTVQTSDEYDVYLAAAFVWDSQRYYGYPFDLTAEEWNRLITWTRGCLENRDIRYEIGDGPSKYPMTEAVEGQPVDNEMFNQVADAVEAAMATLVYTYDGGWAMECLRPGDVKGLLLDRKADGDPVKAYDLTKLQLGANNMVLEYAYADIDKDITDDDWLHHVETHPYGTFTPDTDKIYVVVGECKMLNPPFMWSTWWFEDQHVTLYRWHEYQDDEPYFEKIKDVWIYR